MKKNYTDNSFFNLNYKERKSVFFLISILVVSILIYVIILWWPRKQMYTISSLENTSGGSLSNGIAKSRTLTHNPEKEITLFSFDPNTISKSELENFGLSSKVAATWTNYTSKGGRFYTPMDLDKIYGLKPEEVERMRPFIKILKNKEKTFISLRPVDLNTAQYNELIKIGMPGYIAGTLLKFRKNGKKFNFVNDLKQVKGMNDSILEIVTPFIQFPAGGEVIQPDLVLEPAFEEEAKIHKKEKINLNTADTSQLKNLNGIGSKLALRIVKYRDHLGGFYDINQLKEIYGLPDSTFTKILPDITLDGEIKKIEVNKVDFTRIYHPYINKKHASIIQNFIKQHQPITGINDLKKIEVIEHSFWDKIEPYLVFSM